MWLWLKKSKLLNFRQLLVASRLRYILWVVTRFDVNTTSRHFSANFFILVFWRMKELAWINSEPQPQNLAHKTNFYQYIELSSEKNTGKKQKNKWESADAWLMPFEWCWAHSLWLCDGCGCWAIIHCWALSCLPICRVVLVIVLNQKAPFSMPKTAKKSHNLRHFLFGMKLKMTHTKLFFSRATQSCKII